MHEALVRRKFEEGVGCLTDILVRTSRIVVNSKTFPVLDLTIEHTTPLRLKMGCGQWDERPPSVELLTADGLPLSGSMPGGIFNPGAHPVTGLPFVCMRGTLEYHTHESHISESWEQYKGQDGMDLVSIALQIGNAWRNGLR